MRYITRLSFLFRRGSDNPIRPHWFSTTGPRYPQHPASNPTTGNTPQLPKSVLLGVFNLLILMLLWALSVAGCAAAISMKPAELTPTLHTEIHSIRLAEEVTIHLPTGYQRTLKQGTRWKRIGTVEQGEVFKPMDTVFTIEGRYIHEAYLVVQEDRLIGFFMPVEDAFAPLLDPIPLPLSK